MYARWDKVNIDYNKATDYEIVDDKYIIIPLHTLIYELSVKEGFSVKYTLGENKNNSPYVGTGDIIKIYQIDNIDNAVEYMAVVRGDLNGNGLISAIDLLYIKEYFINKTSFKGAYYKALDVNGDGRKSALDLQTMKQYLLGKAKL